MRVASLRRGVGLVAAAFLLAGCSSSANDRQAPITDVPQSTVERQSIGNCWLYSEASWIESMHLTATGEEFDSSQSYWTYWHWYDQILQDFGFMSEIETGGSQFVADGLVQARGLMAESDFVPEDVTSEMSARQHDAMDFMNRELKEGRLVSTKARSNSKLVREVLDEAWQLPETVKAQLDRAFGADGRRSIGDGANLTGTSIISPDDFAVAYTVGGPSGSSLKQASLSDAMNEWEIFSYPTNSTSRRDFLRRVQRAIHDRQPVILTWNVDFNAMELVDAELLGSFNLNTLKEHGPGRQGGHMVVLEDYEAMTEEFGLLQAGATLDPTVEEDQRKLDALLAPSTEIKFLRVKNSWGAFREDRSTVAGFPGYHDLHMDYLNGPIDWCPNEEIKTEENCFGSAIPLREVALPPGY